MNCGKPQLRCPADVLATVCVPWTDDGAFIEPVFREQVRRLRGAGYENLYIFGTAGEGYAVTDEQFRAVAAAFAEETRDRTGLRQLGVIGLSTPQVRRRIDLGLELGFDRFQISLPCWGPLNDRELDRYFRDVLAPYPQARFLHYNLARSGRILTGAHYARLVGEHANLEATKSGGHTVATLLELAGQSPQLRHFLTELDFAAASLLGLDVGLLVSVSAICPARSFELLRAGREGDISTIRRLTAELDAIRRRVIAVVTAEGGHIDGAFDKLYARMLDRQFPLRLLSPYQCPGDDAFVVFTQWLAREHPGWNEIPPAGEDGTR